MTTIVTHEPFIQKHAVLQCQVKFFIILLHVTKIFIDILMNAVM